MISQLILFMLGLSALHLLGYVAVLNPVAMFWYQWATAALMALLVIAPKIPLWAAQNQNALLITFAFLCAIAYGLVSLIREQNGE